MSSHDPNEIDRANGYPGLRLCPCGRFSEEVPLERPMYLKPDCDGEERYETGAARAHVNVIEYDALRVVARLARWGLPTAGYTEEDRNRLALALKALQAAEYHRIEEAVKILGMDILWEKP